jgi:hypothetical protein
MVPGPRRRLARGGATGGASAQRPEYPKPAQQHADCGAPAPVAGCAEAYPAGAKRCEVMRNREGQAAAPYEFQSCCPAPCSGMKSCPVMVRQIHELALLLILASTSGIVVWALDRWLFVGIFGAEAGWAAILMALLLEPD